ncbi:MAG: GlsB/YeaQ/YmgE family stress response membrane protein [Acidobacteria bacterium]|nr:MAG: GlsB/YeaQ/YmgE family stress response membrane protein [Acidobacteriota bacterium]
MHWLWIAVIGVVIGALAKFVMPGKDPGGFFITALLGIAGPVPATIIGHMAGWYRPGESAGFIMSVLGAILLLVIYRVVKQRLVTS